MRVNTILADYFTDLRDLPFIPVHGYWNVYESHWAYAPNILHRDDVYIKYFVVLHDGKVPWVFPLRVEVPPDTRFSRVHEIQDVARYNLLNVIKSVNQP